MRLYWKRTYWALGSNEHKYIFEMSAVQYLAPGVDRTEFQWHLMVSMEAEWVVVVPK